ncbi:hypothetical protein [Symmachiella dynata]|uniref:hypothetical protein n=1 Tax=Symmachiella dynata TaxID=2527995 RepID=UPI0030EBB7E2
MESEIDAIFRQFIERVDRDTVAEMAERVLIDKAPHGGGIFVFTDYPGGLIGFTLRKLLVDGDYCCDLSDIDELVDRLIDYYGFAQDWVPPLLLVREVLALTVHRRRIIEQLQRDLGKSVDLAPIFDRAAATTIQHTEDAFLLDDERVGVILDELKSTGINEGT